MVPIKLIWKRLVFISEDRLLAGSHDKRQQEGELSKMNEKGGYRFLLAINCCAEILHKQHTKTRSQLDPKLSRVWRGLINSSLKSNHGNVVSQLGTGTVIR